MCVVVVSAQQKITGEVVDADGYAIPLASAMYKGHHVAVVSDIVKPLGIRRIDRMKGAFYVMADDIVAGIYSLIIIVLAQWAI